MQAEKQERSMPVWCDTSQARLPRQRCQRCWGWVLVLCLALGLPLVAAQEAPWEQLMATGAKAFQQGQLVEAEQFYRAALDEVTSAGSDDPRVAPTLNALAVLYHTQGKYAQAETFYQRVLKLLEHTLGADQPALATTMNNLAVVRESQGKLDDAEPLYQRALSLLERIFGPEHPNLAATLDNYADLLRKMQREVEAEALATRAQAIWAGQDRTIDNK